MVALHRDVARLRELDLPTGTSFTPLRIGNLVRHLFRHKEGTFKGLYRNETATGFTGADHEPGRRLRPVLALVPMRAAPCDLVIILTNLPKVSP